MIDGQEYSVDKGIDCINVKKGDEVIGKINVRDEIRPDAVKAIQSLPNVILSSGDSQSEVKRVADELGIDDARHDQSPEDKC